jgi:hypothetical protein
VRALREKEEGGREGREQKGGREEREVWEQK